MSESRRSSDIKEEYVQRALMAGIPGVIAIGAAVVILAYFQLWLVFGIMVLVAGLAAVVYAVVQYNKTREIPDITVECPFCNKKNHLVEQPTSDFRCVHCNRMVPLQDGRMLRVFQVRCGYCNTLNFYSEKSTGLICEECDRVIPIATDDEDGPTKAFSTYAASDDNAPYDLTLADPGNKHEEVINCLQHMLALNRNQVKQIIEEAPVTLLSGIPRRKAEMLKAQIESHGAQAFFKESNG
ncbi:MAG: ribosomal protein L7/L12 [Fimbriimonadaceae bacterium]|nr:ribosomal protein L7/L12 [Fimbriimonadaceae bacterium]